MGWKSKLIEAPVWLVSRFVPTTQAMPAEPVSIFVLRSSDIGDLLVTTPLFRALRERFPSSRIAAGVGDWNREVLENNPYVDEIVAVNMPRYNKFVNPQRTRDFLNYVLWSPEVRAIAAQKYDIGVDIIGSYIGAFFLMRTGIPYRLGVKGFIGGHSAAQQTVQYNSHDHVGRASLRFAELLGATEIPESRPQLFLTEAEREAGIRHWSPCSSEGAAVPRVVVGPGGGFAEKCWPPEAFRELLERLTAQRPLEIVVVGGKQDEATGRMLAEAVPGTKNLAGKLSLRETFALTAASDLVLCNSSMLMHVAAAFRKQTFVFLGEHFASASQHQAQWGYPETCRVLGKDDGHPAVYTPSEAYSQISRYLAANMEGAAISARQ